MIFETHALGMHLFAPCQALLNISQGWQTVSLTWTWQEKSIAIEIYLKPIYFSKDKKELSWTAFLLICAK